ncbi:uncharacterized protein (DUF1684 family) [Allocatelliglobosispora scoriae]|uniref:Uncharacterized protein (DUF1684 family) n=1 Tax=Allocatelliglobosispora scoriae TaxID=643052 RepID=A0A841BZA9_9ACTN|nr:DUF1684 domain-containing protein [Allocatelliglobosispora scoriae]MBB5872926.1 uncharacterized protein (DUF1684 family) [Allocatelliglobosispora scoriae]
MTFTSEQQWQFWRDARLARLRSPYGWLSLTAMHWLTTQDSGFPEVTGGWRAVDGAVVVTATADDGLTLDGSPVLGELVLRPERDLAGVELRLGDKAIEVIRRGDDHAIRVRDPHAPARVAFVDVPTYPFRERWIVRARFQRHPVPVTVAVGTSVDGLTQQQTAVGTLHFTIEGTAHRLTAFGDGDELEVLFRDSTSGITTYGGVRALYPGAPTGDTITLDFNRTLNMPCAFTDFATCPLPPPENTLRVPIEAGEQKPD